MKKIILIHGIGNQDEKWAHSSVEFLKSLTKNSTVVESFNWYDLLDNASGSKRIRFISNLINKINSDPKKYFFLQPLVKWMLDKSSDLLGYKSIREEAFKRLNNSILDDDNEVVIIAHSLGSVLAFEYINLHANFSSKKIKTLITLGSPLDRNPVRDRVFKRMPLVHTPSKKNPYKIHVKWINIWGNFDFVCCWSPWFMDNGGMEYFKPDVDIKLIAQGHDLEGYIQRIPEHYL